MTMSGSISRGRKKKWKVPCLTPFWIENSSKSFTGSGGGSFESKVYNHSHAHQQ
jgi:hypothetical protein